MADLWEDLVGSYLGLDPAMFIQEQYNLNVDGWTACPDFLALDFTARTVWMVEVSVGNSYATKIKEFAGEYVPRLHHQLSTTGVIEHASDWRFGMWVFAKDGDRDAIKAKMQAAGVENGRVCGLAQVAQECLDGTAWKERAERTFDRIFSAECAGYDSLPADPRLK